MKNKDEIVLVLYLSGNSNNNKELYRDVLAKRNFIFEHLGLAKINKIYAITVDFASKELLEEAYCGCDLNFIDFSPESCFFDEVTGHEKPDLQHILSIQVSSLSQILKALPGNLNQEFALVTCWDGFMEDLVCAKPWVIDLSLPKEYIYFKYDPFIDVGYSGQWLFGTVGRLIELKDIGGFYSDEFIKQGEVLESLANGSWPMVKKKSPFVFILRKITNKLASYAISLCKFFLGFKCSSYVSNKINGLVLRLENILNAPYCLGEVSLPNYTRSNKTFSFDKYQFLLRVVIKGYILSLRKRDGIRFIAFHDFSSSHIND